MNAQLSYYQTELHTELGSFLAIADHTQLYLLEFTHRRHLARQIARIQKNLSSRLIENKTAPMHAIETELYNYCTFAEYQFSTSIDGIGSSFQKKVWAILRTIPYGETRSYADIAAQIGKPAAVRAVANAVGANPLAIIIPCHRVIRSDGSLGGYAGGLERKQWLLQHEGISIRA